MGSPLVVHGCAEIAARSDGKPIAHPAASDGTNAFVVGFALTDGVYEWLHVRERRLVVRQGRARYPLQTQA